MLIDLRYTELQRTADVLSDRKRIGYPDINRLAGKATKGFADAQVERSISTKPGTSRRSLLRFEPPRIKGECWGRADIDVKRF